MRKIEESSARKILLSANKHRKIMNDVTGNLIEKVLRGSHKTYKYILVTALLAKSTNQDVDALSLQAGDDSEGSYDARSLCHKVVVPFEREYYPNGVGGSNEPYLNKPARFARLSEDNAVRRGNDKETLKTVIKVLSSIKTSKSSFKYLSSAIFNISQISREEADKFKLPDLDIPQSELPQTTLDYVIELTKESFEEHLLFQCRRHSVPCIHIL